MIVADLCISRENPTNPSALKGGTDPSEYLAARPADQPIDRSAKKAIINQGKLEIYCDSQQIRETAAVDVVVGAAASRVRKSNGPLNELEKLRTNVKDKTQSRI